MSRSDGPPAWRQRARTGGTKICVTVHDDRGKNTVQQAVHDFVCMTCRRIVAGHVCVRCATLCSVDLPVVAYNKEG